MEEFSRLHDVRIRWDTNLLDHENASFYVRLGPGRYQSLWFMDLPSHSPRYGRGHPSRSGRRNEARLSWRITLSL